MRAVLLTAMAVATGCDSAADCDRKVREVRAQLDAARAEHLSAAQRHARAALTLELLSAMRQAEALAADPRVADGESLRAAAVDGRSVFVLDASGAVVASSQPAPGELTAPVIAATREHRGSAAELTVLPGAGLVQLAVASTLGETGEVTGAVVVTAPRRGAEAARLADDLGVGVAFVTGDTIHASSGSDDGAVRANLAQTIDLPRMSSRPLPPTIPKPSVSIVLFLDVTSP